MPVEDFSTRGAPWGWQPSLEAKCREVNVDFNHFIDGQKNNRADTELAKELGVNTETITGLRKHFEKYGIDSMMGQD